MKKFMAIFVAFLIAVGAVLCTERVHTGYVGVIYSAKGVEQQTISQGWHFMSPLKHVSEFPITQQRVVFSNAPSDYGAKEHADWHIDAPANGGTIAINLTVNYNFLPEHVVELYTKFGGMDGESLMESKIQNDIIAYVKEVTPQFSVTWDPNGGQPFTDETLDKIVDLLRPDYIQGLTLTGGDPLYQENREMICKILIRVRHEFEGSKDIWMWTGYTWEELIQQAAEELKYQTIPTTVTIIRNINVLVDGPYIESKRDISLPYMGSSNQRVIGCNKSFALRRPVLWWTPEEKKGK